MFHDSTNSNYVILYNPDFVRDSVSHAEYCRVRIFVFFDLRFEYNDQKNRENKFQNNKMFFKFLLHYIGSVILIFKKFENSYLRLGFNDLKKPPEHHYKSKDL